MDMSTFFLLQSLVGSLPNLLSSYLGGGSSGQAQTSSMIQTTNNQGPQLVDYYINTQTQKRENALVSLFGGAMAGGSLGFFAGDMLHNMWLDTGNMTSSAGGISGLGRNLSGAKGAALGLGAGLLMGLVNFWVNT